MKCCIIILTYNGLEHIKVCVPSALKAAEQVPGECPVIVVDNGSTDESAAWIREHYPQVEVIASKNDYVFSMNPVVASRSEDIVVILNDDMWFDEKFIAVMLPYFEDPNVFSVSAKVFDWEGREVSVAQQTAEIRNFWFYKKWNKELSKPCLSLAAGGCSAMRREMFVELGGFDKLYRPAYWEDMDLSYRAWRRGWKIIYEPKSHIYHRVGATLNKTEGGNRNVTRLIRRNEVLFSLRNVGGWGYVAAYLALLPLRMLNNARMGNHTMWQGALRAVPKIPFALAKRWSDRKTQAVSDSEFLDLIGKSAMKADGGE